MATTPRGPGQMLAACRAEHDHPSRDWTGKCQMFSRLMYDVQVPLFSTAYLQWLGAHPDDKHIGGKPSDAPVGALLCTKGANPAGHIYPAARPFRNGTPGAWSNDLVRTGHINKVPRTAPMTQWGHKYLGYLTSINHFDIAALHIAPQTKHYAAIATAIANLRVSRNTAWDQKDFTDVKILDAEIARLQGLYDTLRHA